MGDAPGQCDLCAVLVVFLADVEEDRVVDQLAHAFAGVVDLVLVAEGRVLGDVDVAVLVEVGERGLGEVGVHLDLVDGGRDGGGLEESVELGFGEVRDSDGSAFAVLDELFHRFVGLHEWSV